nr:uncharacterized protein LOC105342798 isoform X2 [Crassostrea gigas]
MFRQGYVRHNSYYVFINKVVADVNELTSLSPVYYESDSRPSAQNIIMFPGGISGKQLYIYKNTSGPSQYNNSILDICEIEIWGCLNHSEDQKCKCSHGHQNSALPSACVEAPYNPETTYAHHIGPITLRFGDNLSIVCKHGHRLVAVKSYQSLPEKRFMEWRKTNLQTLYSGHIQC